MKKKMSSFTKRAMALLLTLLLIIPAGVIGVFAATPYYTATDGWGDYDGDGVFEIATPGDLLAMAKYRLNYGNYEGATVVLTADIDLNPGWDASSRTVPTNVWATMWNMKGTLDGQGHTISGIYSTGDSNGKNASFITAGIGGTTIKNLIVENSYFVSKDCSAFIACARGEVVMENVLIDAIMEATQGGAAGFVGWFYTSEASTPSVELTNCAFVGTVRAQTWAGGFVGTNQKDTKDTKGLGTYSVTLTDCANYGDVISGSFDAAAGLIGACANEATLTRCYNAGIVDTALVNLYTNNNYNSFTVTLEDCYYQDTQQITPIVSASAIGTTLIIKYDGAATSLAKSSSLNALVTKTAFGASATSRGWALYMDMFPLPVVVIDLLNGQGEYEQPEENPDLIVTPVYTANPNWGDHDYDGVFEIATPGDLLAMAAQRKNNNNYLGATIILTADIDLNPGWDATTRAPATNVWPECFYMKGTFDGQGHTIRGLYSNGDATGQNATMFVLSEGSSTVKNLKIENTYFHSRENATGIFAAARGSLVFENVYVDAICECNYGAAAGFVSWFNCSSSTMTPSVTLINCVFEGYVEGGTSAAAFVATNNRPAGNKGQGTYNVTMIDCANYGIIDCTDYYRSAGLIGECANNATLIRCYNGGLAYTGLVNLHTSASQNLSGQPVEVMLQDCYYLDTYILTAVANNAPATTLRFLYDGTAATTAKSATPAELVTKTAFLEYGTYDGWVLREDGLAVPAPIYELFGEGDDDAVTTPGYTPNMNWAPDANNIFEIATPGDLLAMADPTVAQRYNYYEGYTIILTTDIDLNPGWDASGDTVPANVWTPCAYMRGILDGQGHTIAGLYSEGINGSGACFIQTAEDGCIIRNLVFENCYFYAEKEAAGLIAVARGNVLIENILSGILCEVGFAGDGYAGGFVSRISASDALSAPGVTIKNCVFAGAVMAPKIAGAFVGTNATWALDQNQEDYRITMIDCVSYGIMICMNAQGELATDGLTGLVGECANNATLIRCYNAGFTDAGLINVTKNEQTTQDDVVITLEDCYYYPEMYTAGIIKAPDATATVVIKYDGAVATETQSATTAELLQKAAYQPSGAYKGWVGYTEDETEAIVFPVVIACMVGGHDFDDGTITPPTCAALGYTVYTCELCGYSYTADFVNATENHTDGDWIIDKAAAQCTPGQKHKECTVCGVTTKTEAIAMIPHDYEMIVVAPTCEEQGYTQYVCKHCGDNYRENYTTLPHTEGDWIVDREADGCKTDGLRHKVCTVCGATTVTETIAKAAHTYEAVVTAPTCQAQGYTTHACKNCGDSYRDTYVSANPNQHTESEWIIDRVATEHSAGQRHKECIACKKQIKVEVIPKIDVVDPCVTGHDYESTVTAPTCTAKGYTTYKCKNCEDTYVSDPTETVAHTASEWIVDKEPTEESVGVQHKECTACKAYMENGIIPALGANTDDGNTGGGCQSSVTVGSAFGMLSIICLGAAALGKKRR